MHAKSATVSFLGKPVIGFGKPVLNPVIGVTDLHINIVPYKANNLMYYAL